MNPSQQASRAYAPSQAHLRSARSVESQIIAGITARLRSAVASRDFPGLAAALHENRRLWIRLAADVADSDNGLPAPLRARLCYLAQFTEVHSRRVLHDDADPAVLVEINTAVLRGLADGAPARVSA